ncbi:11491_t:CDS:2 [Funneliformis geosporum]|uniref:11491_t:CDS:1 n=1 Tax=Funneliformis geosporum TaxID=1117311 RepID=A0A9W4SS17_9GLOM|nr:11491_t:CDS:2 [Funneliformis geosporum]
MNENFLNEWKNHLEFAHSAQHNQFTSPTRLYGITQDPESLDYMIVLKMMKLGSLRSNLMIKKYNPNDKYYNLYYVARALLALHKCNLFHGDFHSGNLLLSGRVFTYISDLGLSRPIDKPNESDEIYGVLPYIAPEVLLKNPYTQAADIYSFGIIMWEMTSGNPAYNDRPHDYILALEICNGLRPTIVEGTMPKYIELMERCWNSDPSQRPTAEELVIHFKEWRGRYLIGESVQVPEHEYVIENHPLSCYTSKKINYSARLVESLNRTELSSEIIIKDETMISESLGGGKEISMSASCPDTEIYFLLVNQTIEELWNNIEGYLKVSRQLEMIDKETQRAIT